MSERYVDYAIVIEPTDTGFSAYVPDLPGCVAAAGSKEDVRQLLREAVEFHIEGLIEDGLPVPQPTSLVDYVHVAQAA